MVIWCKSDFSNCEKNLKLRINLQGACAFVWSCDQQTSFRKIAILLIVFASFMIVFASRPVNRSSNIHYHRRGNLIVNERYFCLLL